MYHKVVIVGVWIGIPENGPLAELATGGTGTSATTYRKVAVIKFTFTLDEVDDWKRRLVVVMCEEKVIGEGSIAPGLADNTTTEDILIQQPNEYLFDYNCLGQVIKDSQAIDVLHDGCLLVFSLKSGNS
jgi:hypothetical protein